MEQKTCLHCGKIFFKKDYQRYGYTDMAWKARKCCSNDCTNEHNFERNRKNYTLKKTEHNMLVRELNKKVKGEIIYRQNLTEDTNPDIKKEDSFIELELLGAHAKLKKKKSFLPSGKKFILYVAIPKKTQDLFDEIHFVK